MELGQQEVSEHDFLDSFETAPTDSLGARSTKPDGAPPTLPSLDYTDSHPVDNRGGEQANPEETTKVEVAREVENDDEQEEEAQQNARRIAVRMRLQQAQQDEEASQPYGPTYGRAEDQFAPPMPQMTGNVDMVLPTEGQIGAGIAVRTQVYMINSRGARSESPGPRSYQPFEIDAQVRSGNTEWPRDNGPAEEQRGRLTSRFTYREGASRENSQAVVSTNRSRSPVIKNDKGRLGTNGAHN